IWFEERKEIAPDAETELESLTDQDYMIYDFQIPGFSLHDKKWCLFSVDFIEPVIFNVQAFETLLLPKKHKDIVHALVKNHGSDDFDDMIKGKGKGLVFVLYGEPGVGKTFTAESIADDIQKPLYMLNSGELGFEPVRVESNLNSALKLAAHWGAIVLIDETDVFLEQRTIHDLTRNSLVSKLWKMFIDRTSKNTTEAWPESVFDDISKVTLNGRQIKNAARTANTLAKSAQVPLGKEHIELVIDTIRESEEDFNNNPEDPARGSL
ncbi:hypothetical protein LSUE1_G006111, partial [Lachnellula suecica]